MGSCPSFLISHFEFLIYLYVRFVPILPRLFIVGGTSRMPSPTSVPLDPIKGLVVWYAQGSLIIRSLFILFAPPRSLCSFYLLKS